MATIAEALDLASRFQRTGDLQQAELVCRQILQADPTNAAALGLLGVVAYQVRRPDLAAEYIRQAATLEPLNAAYHSNLGLALQALGRLDEAIAACRQAIQLDPELAYAHGNLANALAAQDRPEEAAVSCRRALQLRPEIASAHHNLGLLLKNEGRMEEAASHLEEALRLQPTNRLRVLLATMLPPIYSSTADLQAWRTRLMENIRQLHTDGAKVDLTNDLAPNIFYLPYQGQNDRDIMRELAHLYVAPDHHPAAHAARLAARIRIGFISKYFMQHTIGELMSGIIAGMSRHHFDVTVLSLGKYDDPIARFIQQHADHYLVLPLNLPAARKMIAEQELDILFYADIGMEPLTYSLAFSRLAPVQCVTWGHPVTTGINTIDYYLSSELFEVAGAEGHYTEKLVRLANLPCYCYRYDLPAQVGTKAHFDLPEDCHLYACPQSLFKFHPEFDALLAGILRKDPLGILVINRSQFAHGKHWEELLWQRFSTTMPDIIERIRWLPRLDHNDYLRLNAVTDVLLDTIHFNGGNTSLKALALGVPIVTLPSEFLRGRITQALYRQMGVMDCVAQTPDQYIAIAVRLGTDKDYRAAIHEKILAASNVLFENPAAIREMETFFKSVARRG